MTEADKIEGRLREIGMMADQSMVPTDARTTILRGADLIKSLLDAGQAERAGRAKHAEIMRVEVAKHIAHAAALESIVADMRSKHGPSAEKDHKEILRLEARIVELLNRQADLLKQIRDLHAELHVTRRYGAGPAPGEEMVRITTTNIESDLDRYLAAEKIKAENRAIEAKAKAINLAWRSPYVATTVYSPTRPWLGGLSSPYVSHGAKIAHEHIAEETKAVMSEPHTDPLPIIPSKRELERMAELFGDTPEALAREACSYRCKALPSTLKCNAGCYRWHRYLGENIKECSFEVMR